MIIGISMGLETCLILGQVSHNLHSTKKLLTDILGPGERLTRKQLTSRTDHFMARTLGENGEACQAEGEAKVVE